MRNRILAILVVIMVMLACGGCAFVNRSIDKGVATAEKLQLSSGTVTVTGHYTNTHIQVKGHFNSDGDYVLDEVSGSAVNSITGTGITFVGEIAHREE